MSQAVLRLQSSKRKSLLLAIISLAFTAAGIWMIVSEGSWKAYAATVFFGICTVVHGRMMMRGGYLELRPEAFTVSSLYRTSSYQWRDVRRFRVGYLGPKKFVLFDMAKDYPVGVKVRRATRMLTGSEGALPDTYGKSAEELATLMNEWRERASTGGGVPGKSLVS
jgi:hypothetical protein